MISDNNMGFSHETENGTGVRPSSGLPMVPVSVENPNGNANGDDVRSLNVHDLWSAFRRHWFLSVAVGILAALPVVYLAWTYIPTPYRAEAEIHIKASRPRINFDLQEDRVNSQVFKASQMKTVLHPSTLMMALDDHELSKLSPVRNLEEGLDEVDWLRDQISVRDSGEEFFTISMEGEDPVAVASIVNAVASAYIAQSKAESNLSSGTRYRQIEEQLEDLGKSIDIKQQDIDELSKIAKAANEEQLNIWMENQRNLIGDLQAVLRTVELRLIEINARLESLKAPTDEEQHDRFAGTDLDSIIKNDERYRALKSQIANYERNIAKWKEAFNSDSVNSIQKLKDAADRSRERLDELYQELEQTYRAKAADAYLREHTISLVSLQQEKEGLLTLQKKTIERIKDLEKEGNRTVDTGIELAKIRTLLEEEKGLATSLRAERNKIDIEKDAGERIQVSYEAKVPQRRETRRRDLVTAGGGLATFGLVIVLFTLVELKSSRVNSLKALEYDFQLPILGAVPQLPVRVLQNMNGSGKGARFKDSFTESFDSARTILLNRKKRSPLQIIMVTSAVGGEGKSTLSSHLAISFARAGKKTLLIDGDLRQPRLHDVFQISDFPGFCEALRGETIPQKCISSSAVGGLDILPAGDVDQVTLKMLAEEQTHQVLESLRQDYDIVVFDSAPVLPVADSLLLLQSVDGVILSIRKGHSRMTKVASALRKIDLVEGKILGGIVIGANDDDYGGYSNHGKEPVTDQRLRAVHA